MKRSNKVFAKTALATLTAMYVASLGATTSSPQTNTLKVEKVAFNSQAIKAQMESHRTSLDEPLLVQGDGRNVMIKPPQKFIAGPADSGSHTYLIRLRDTPAALHKTMQNDGTKMPLFATNTLGARQQNPLSEPEVASYIQQLKQQQTNFVVNAKRKTGIDVVAQHSFQIAINGIASHLSNEDAERLSKLPEVASVRAVQTYDLLTDTSHGRIGTENAWMNTQYGTSSGLKGEGMLVGVIDTGISPSHPMFQATGDDGYTVVNPLGSGNYLHDCTIEGFEDLCNDKLIGIWSHPEITAAYSDPEAGPYGVTRPAIGIDYQGHGTHTASTAAGNIVYNVKHKLPALAMTSTGIETGITLDQVSGVAPHANIISYQACSPGNVPSLDKYIGCSSVPLVAAIEQAIIDGVDVINYSISGGWDPHNDDVELAFLAAHEAGINVSASAGNAGTYQSVQHISPWVLSVGSTQTGRTFSIAQSSRAINLEGGVTPPRSWRTDIFGTFTSDISGPVVLASDYGNEFCEEPFSHTFTNGEIVFCARSDSNSANGAIANKVKHAKDAGAAALVVYNTENSNADLYYTLESDIPLGMTPESNAKELVAWLSEGSDHRFTIPQSNNTVKMNETMVDAISGFSSIGHAAVSEYREATAPGIAAPGSDIFAADTTDQPFTYAAQAAVGSMGPADYGVKSGTSMASPHIAGAMALVKQAHPHWSPSEVMSAIQLTANDAVKNALGREENIHPWFHGSGIAQVDKAVNAGLVMHVPVEHYQLTNPYGGGNLGALNTPNMVDERCFYRCSWIREVTATVDGTWDVTTSTDEYSVQVDVEPKQFTLKKGETQRLTITGSWQNAQSITNSARGATVFGKVQLTAQDPSVPVSQMNVEMSLDSGKLPEIMEYTSHTDAPTFRIDNQPLGKATAPQVTVYEPVKAQFEEFTLKELPNGNGSEMFSAKQDITSETLHVSWVDVPENAVRLIAEHVSAGPATVYDERTAPKGNISIYVGIDANGDNQVQYDDEVICKSTVKNTEITEFCNIPYPEAGNYWVVWEENNQNKWGWQGKEDAWFPHKVATAVVLGDVAESAQSTVTKVADSEVLSDIAVKFNSLEQQTGERHYSAIEIGSDSQNPSNIGLVSINVNRGDDVVSFHSDKARAIAGDKIAFELDVLPNTSGGDRLFDISGELPDGLTLEDVYLSNNGFITGDVAVDGNSFTVSGLQNNSLGRKSKYNITNSITDQSCKTPVGNGGYIDLLSYGLQPEPSAPVIPTDGAWEVPFAALFSDKEEGEQFTLFHNYEHGNGSDSLYIHPTGAVDFTGAVTFNYRFADDNFNSPPQLMGAFWYNRFHPVMSKEMAWGAPYQITDAEGQALPDSEVAGITVSRLIDPASGSGTHVVVEWDNLQHMQGKDGCDYWTCGLDIEYEPLEGNDMRVDTQAIIARGYDHSPGAYEVIYAYDNLHFEDWGW
ncbi:S8 family serine peptidase [Pseudoalteromonas sp. GB56]